MSPISLPHHYHPRIHQPHWSLSPFAARRGATFAAFSIFVSRIAAIHPFRKMQQQPATWQTQIRVSWWCLMLSHRWDRWIELNFVCETAESMAATEQIRIWHTPPWWFCCRGLPCISWSMLGRNGGEEGKALKSCVACHSHATGIC